MRPLTLLTLIAATTFAAAAPVPTPKAAEKKDRVVSNPAKDIYVVTDRDETVKDWFTRNRVVVGSVLAGRGTRTMPTLEAIVKAKAPVRVFASYPSRNDVNEEQTFGVHLDVAPPSAAVAEMLKATDGKIHLVFRLGDDGKYHVAGYTARQTIGFFDDAKANKADGYSQKELRYAAKK